MSSTEQYVAVVSIVKKGRFGLERTVYETARFVDESQMQALEKLVQTFPLVKKE